MNNRVQSIDGLRLFLFLGIYLFHAYGEYFPIGWGGVECFLLITSFFLTSKLLHQNPTDIRIIPSVIRRAKRLYPLYILIVVVMAMAGTILQKRLPDDFFSYFIFAQNYYWLYDPDGSRVFACGHFWYLTLDVYLVLIWLILFKYVNRQYIVQMLLALIVLAIVYRAYFSQVNPLLAYMVPFGAIDSFALGGLLAVTAARNNASKRIPIAVFTLGGVGLVACIVYVTVLNGVSLWEGLVLFKSSAGYAHDPYAIQVLLTIPLMCYGLVWFCIIPRNHYVLSNPKIVEIGGMTYELYLVHYPLLTILTMLSENKIIVSSLGLVLTFGATIIWNKFKASIVQKKQK